MSQELRFMQMVLVVGHYGFPIVIQAQSAFVMALDRSLA
jgi:hypothetical protein